MTPEQLEDIQRMVALRMSINDETGELSWKQWSTQISRRVAAVQMWTVDETRPTFKSVLELAADAMTLLALVDMAEQADFTGEAAA